MKETVTIFQELFVAITFERYQLIIRAIALYNSFRLIYFLPNKRYF